MKNIELENLDAVIASGFVSKEDLNKFINKQLKKNKSEMRNILEMDREQFLDEYLKEVWEG